MENDEQNYYMPESEGIDFRRYFSLFISNWYWFAGALMITIALAYGANRWGEEYYTVQSTMLINDEQYGGGYAEMDKIIPGGDIFRARQNLRNEIGILKSFDLNHKVMYELTDFHVVYTAVGKRGIAESRMYRNSPFVVQLDTATVRFQPGKRVDIKILSAERYELAIEADDYEGEHSFGEHFDRFGFDFIITPRHGETSPYVEGGSNKYYFYVTTPAALANSYRSRLSVAPIEEEATLVTLTISGLVPEQEADYLNTLMETYRQQGLDWKNEAADKTIKFIDEQLNFISDSLSSAEDDMERFRLNNSFVDLTTEGNLVLQRLERYANEKNTLNLQMQYYEYLKEYLVSRNESGLIVSPSVMGVGDPMLIRLVEELSQLQLQQKQLRFVVRDELPAASLITGKVEQARESLMENVNSSINQLKISVGDVEGRIADVEKQLGRLPGTERRLIQIQRDFDLNNTVYNFLLERRAEAGIAMASKVSDSKIIDEAEPYNAMRIRPKTRQNYMMALILGLLIPAVFIILIDLMNNKVIDKKDIERATKAPILGFISHSGYGSELPVTEKPGSTLAESFRSIRTSLKYFIPEGQPAVIAVTSTVSGEGKTFVAMNLAAIISMLGKKTLLIGLDLRKPRIHKILKLSNTEGMSTFLSGNSKFDDVIQKTSIENLWFATSGPIPPNPAELIERQSMTDFLEKARKEFDYVIIDTPPAAVVTDALLLAGRADVTLFVVRQRYSSKNTLHLIDEIYRNKEIKNPGIIVNDISMSGYYGYGLRYGYTMGYSYGYNYGYKYYGHTSYGRGARDEAGSYYTED
ncbi:MAG: polysaccharide biosynthesis tyrosine autokinase [Bacteroidales bacterium]|nr:polysaccharide biosynthesis tyrosine autokinase [Bacteroidales bacterium]